MSGLSDLDWQMPPGWLEAFVGAVTPQLLHMPPVRRRTCYVALAGLHAGLAARLGQDFESLFVMGSMSSLASVDDDLQYAKAGW